MSKVTHTVTILILCLCRLSSSFQRSTFHVGIRKLNSISGRIIRLAVESSLDTTTDISPNKDRSILKKLLRPGDPAVGLPLAKDSVAIEWKIFHTDGSLIHDSSASATTSTTSSNDQKLQNIDGQSSTLQNGTFEIEDEHFQFKLGAEPRQVITGWEYAVKTMHQGELAQFTILPEYAFGSKGAPPLIGPDTTLLCELELLRIIPALSRKFKSVGYNESIRDELMEQIQSGQSPVAPAVTHTRSNRDLEPGNQVKVENPGAVSSNRHSNPPHTTSAGTESGSRNSQSAQEYSTSHNSNNEAAPPRQGQEEGMEAKYFDPEKHTLDSKLQVTGTGRGYTWTENRFSLDIEIPLPMSSTGIMKKGEIIVDISVSSISVKLRDGTVLLDGPLHGRVVPSECSWSLLDYPAHQVYKTHATQYVQVSLEKGHQYREVWATVLDRAFLKKMDGLRLAHSEEYVRYQDYLTQQEAQHQIMQRQHEQQGNLQDDEIVDVSYVDVVVNKPVNAQ